MVLTNSRLSYFHFTFSCRFILLSFHPWTSYLHSVFLALALLKLNPSTLPSLIFRYQACLLNLLPFWVGYTSGSYLRGAILVFPLALAHIETLTICFYRVKSEESQCKHASFLKKYDGDVVVCNLKSSYLDYCESCL